MRVWRQLWHDILLRLVWLLILSPFVAAGFVWYHSSCAFSVGTDIGRKFFVWVSSETPKQ